MRCGRGEKHHRYQRWENPRKMFQRALERQLDTECGLQPQLVHSSVAALKPCGRSRSTPVDLAASRPDSSTHGDFYVS
jgi:hypothetical protein